MPKPDYVRSFVLTLGLTEQDGNYWLERRKQLIDKASRGDSQDEPATQPASTSKLPLSSSPELWPPVAEDQADGHSLRWRKPMTVASAAILAVAVISGGTFLAFQPGSEGASLVEGEVTCQSGAQVVGVWIQTENGPSSGFAARSTSGAGVRYEYALSEGTRYAVHVGCGGTRENWDTNNRSGYGTGPFRSFVCRDQATPSEGRKYGICDEI